MKAIIRTKAGKEFSSMRVQDLNSSSPKEEEVAIKMCSSRINPVDMDLMKGFPGLKYKKPQIGGVDGAGTIMSIGKGVEGYEIGDQVFFYRKFTDIGTWAEEIIISANDIAKIPKSLTLEEAGGVALPMLTAYECLSSLNPQSGSTILIHGAGGGVGFQAVQLAKAMKLKVIANASKRDQDKLREVGVEQVIDYKSQDFYAILKEKRPAYILDVIGKDTLLKSIQLRPKKVVSTSFPDTDQMWKTGVQLPAILKWLMNLMNRKFVKAAKKNNVELIGQVTGASGKNLEAAARLSDQINYVSPISKSIHFSEIKSNGLSKKDLTKVILF